MAYIKFVVHRVWGVHSTNTGRWLPPLSLAVGLPWRRRSLAHLEHELVDFVIRVRVENDRNKGGVGLFSYDCLSEIISLPYKMWQIAFHQR